MKTQNSIKHDTINQFIIEMTLIDPLLDIIKKLKNSEYRDCDINYLNKKLMDYMLFACKMQNINTSINGPKGEKDGVIMNNFVKELYISRFETLLKYFETI